MMTLPAFMVLPTPSCALPKTSSVGPSMNIAMSWPGVPFTVIVMSLPLMPVPM